MLVRPNSTLLLEIKSTTGIQKVHQSQVLTYLRLLQLHEGLLINFNWWIQMVGATS